MMNTASTPGPPVKRADLRKPELSVAEIMRTDFRSCNAGTPILEVATALRQSRCGFLAVTRAQVPLGIVTGTDLAAALGEHGTELSRLTAKDLMIEASTIAMKTSIDVAANCLPEAGGYLLAVNANRELKGIVTLAEVGPQLSESALGRLVARLVPEAFMPGHALPTAEEARMADPTAEIKSAKSQAQPHAWDSPTGAHPEPVPLISPSDLVNPMLKVADVMTPEPRTCSPASTALEAVMTCRDANCGFVPVTDDGRPVGVVTDRDIALALADHEADLGHTPLEALMTREVVTIEADASLNEAIAKLGDHGLRRLLVVDHDGHLTGVLSWTDLAPHLSHRGLGYAVSQIVEHR